RLDVYLAKEPNDRLAMFVAATRVSIANFLRDLPRADREATRAIELAKKNDNQHLLAVLTNLLSGIRYQQKRYAEAAQLAENGIELSRAIPVQFKIANEKAAKAYEKLGRIDDAKRALQAAIDSIEGELANVPGTEDDKQTFYQDKSMPYLGMFRLLAAEHQPEKAIEWV